jgi:small subunit ribosomal protein S7
VKRDIGKDPKYGDWLVQKFINCLMKDGKKATAEGVLYSVFDDIERRTNEDPLKFFKRALDNVRPAVEVKSRRVGGSTYQVPVEVRPDRRTALAIRWLILYARKRGERGMVHKLAAEIIDAANNRGSSVKKKEDTHRMAEANKAFSHFRW